MKKRLELVDAYRGLTIISMILFHACWIASYFGIALSMETIFSRPFVIWERTICCSFIFISGFVYSLGKRHLKNGLIVLSLGILITIGSVLFLYEIRDIFGVLWILGIYSLIMIPVDKFFEKKSVNKLIYSFLIAVIMIFLVMTWNINSGFLGLEGIYKIDLSPRLYNGYIMTFIGFMDPTFYSVDYFSFFPWIFVFLEGYFIHKIIRGTCFEEKILTIKVPGLSEIGKHSLILYLIHPIIIFVICTIIEYFK